MAIVCILGTGYVGCVTAACIARDGHRVIAVDTDADKVRLLSQGVPPVSEPGLDELIRDAIEQGRLSVTTQAVEAIQQSDAAIIAVGTPTGEDGRPNLSAVAAVSDTIGLALKGLDRPFAIMMRSTVPPGTVEELIGPRVAAASSREVGVGSQDIALMCLPEFLREVTAIADYDDPPFVVVGAGSPPPSQAQSLIQDLFGQFTDRTYWVSVRSAELLKNVCNAWHATKVVFANEVGQLCEAKGIDGRELMDVFCKDDKLNVSSYYLKPGAPFGGSCLPKDLRAMLVMADEHTIPTPQLAGTLHSNELFIDRALAAVEAVGAKAVGIDGLSFKKGTDDMRESPTAIIGKRLLEEGYDVRAHDPNVATSHTAAGGPYARLVERLVSDEADLTEHAQVIIKNSGVAPRGELSRGEVPVIDLAKLPAAQRCWLTHPDGTQITVGARGISIGRAASNAIVLNARRASSIHAMVCTGPSGPLVVALGRNPTLVNGEPVRGSAPLAHGDTIAVPGLQLKVSHYDAVGRRAGVWAIRRSTGSVFSVNGAMFRVGGGSSESLHVPSLSPHAATFYVVQQALLVELGVPGRINGEEVPSGVLEPVTMGSVIEVGDEELQVLLDVDTSGGLTDVDARGLPPTAAALSFHAFGALLKLRFGQDEVAVELPQAQAALVGLLLNPPGPEAAGADLSDEVLASCMWPPRQRHEIDRLVNQLRHELLEVGVNAYQVIRRARGGTTTAFVLRELAGG